MEPLARWLHAGSRGYAHGCLEAIKAKPQMQLKCRTPCSSYADDSSLFQICNTIGDLCLQVEKVNQYASWGDIKTQPAKCAATGMPHADIASGAVFSPQSWIGTMQLKNRLACVKIGPHHIPFAHPDKEPQNSWVSGSRQHSTGGTSREG